MTKNLLEKIKQFWGWIVAGLAAILAGVVLFLTSKPTPAKRPVSYPEKLQEKLDKDAEEAREGLYRILDEIREEKENLSNFQKDTSPEVRVTSFDQVRYARKNPTPPPVPTKSRK